MRFEPGEGLCDCENRWIVCSSIVYWWHHAHCPHHWDNGATWLSCQHVPLSLVPDVSVTRAQCGHRYWPRNTRVISAIIGIGHCHSLLKINFLIWYKQCCDLWCAVQSMEIYLKCIGSIFSRTFKPWKQLQCATNSVYYIEWLWRNLSKFWTDFNQYFVTCQ